ncbi:hypothetical protein OUZ56_018311 [Daphnia magna]|uniref:Uncharacterized protein n=1 Tax=Daphnia magna TaxID=35525 RepID=A0ABQ9Z8H4_9CRUS|nr:hypothetical protein OUZ56_018311 [Daphnia magna]
MEDSFTSDLKQKGVYGDHGLQYIKRVEIRPAAATYISPLAVWILKLKVSKQTVRHMARCNYRSIQSTKVHSLHNIVLPNGVVS